MSEVARPRNGRVRVTSEDLENGGRDSQIIWNDYLIITAGDRYVAHVTAHANGTHVITVKVDR